jgi:hypothetical protein
MLRFMMIGLPMALASQTMFIVDQPSIVVLTSPVFAVKAPTVDVNGIKVGITELVMVMTIRKGANRDLFSIDMWSNNPTTDSRISTI